MNRATHEFNGILWDFTVQNRDVRGISWHFEPAKKWGFLNLPFAAGH
jgi:hypothetical protein